MNVLFQAFLQSEFFIEFSTVNYLGAEPLEVFPASPAGGRWFNTQSFEYKL